MASILSGYEYDIFISYRHNDNLDGWVTNFVESLEKELRGTLKESLSIYFDKNPHDGLLETHNVDKSLEGKLKCLIFIPIISQTYCDTKSFAWQHEFVAFNKLAQEDQLGRDIKLSKGNVASRILPIKIHDLDLEDASTIENEIGGALRGIEFIYKEAGVNRPLVPDDSEEKNLNRTKYKNQLNKVANAIKEILTTIKPPEKTFASKLEKTITHPTKSTRKLGAIVASIVVVLALAVYFLYPKILPVPEPLYLDKSIAVLPFVDMSENHDKEYFTDGMMEEILNHLHKIGELKVTSRTSSMQYKGETNKSIKEIAQELGVGHILEGSVRLQGNMVRITVQLIKAETDQHLWAENYDRDFSDVFYIQSEVAQEVANTLKATISPEAQRIIETRPTSNSEAYELLLKARELGVYVEQENNEAIALLKKAVELDPNFSQAWAGIAFRSSAVNTYLSNVEGSDPQKIWKESKPYLEKAILADPDNGNAHSDMAWAVLWNEWNFERAAKEYAETKRIFPNYSWTDYLLALGQFEEAYKGALSGVEVDARNTIGWTGILLSSYFVNKNAKGQLRKVLSMPNIRDNIWVRSEAARIYMYLKEYDQAISITQQMLEDYPEVSSPRLGAIQAISYFHTNRMAETNRIIDELKIRSEKSAGGSASFYLAMIYAAMGEADQCFYWLDKSYQKHDVELYWLKVEPPFEIIRNDPRYQVMLDKVGFPK